jgi:hypothetical protein
MPCDRNPQSASAGTNVFVPTPRRLGTRFRPSYADLPALSPQRA